MSKEEDFVEAIRKLSEGRILIIDVGEVKVKIESGVSGSKEAKLWSAPELFKEEEGCDYEKAGVFSIALIVSSLIKNERPFGETSAQAIQERLEQGDRPDLQELQVDGKKIYLMRIAVSFNKPHIVKNDYIFYGRHSSGKYKLDIGEIRNLFLFNASLKEKFENFRIQRLMKIRSSKFSSNFFFQNPMSLKSITLHIASIKSINEVSQLDISSIKNGEKGFMPLGSIRYTSEYNFDGIFYYHNEKRNINVYTQLFRNGIIETTSFSFYQEAMLKYSEAHVEQFELNGCNLENSVTETIVNYISLLEPFSIGFPFFLSLSLLNTKNSRLSDGVMHLAGFNGHLIMNDDLLLPTIFIEKQSDLPMKLKNIYAIIWNAGGYEKSPLKESIHAHP
jgi:hypothetical protein